MNISKALKVKNRLTGRLADLENSVRQSNSVMETQISNRSVSISVIWTELVELRKNIISLKSAIATASAGIAHKLVALAEKKSELSFIKSIMPVEGVGYEYENGVQKSVKYVNFISFAEKASKEKVLSDEIAALQDEIDDYNASTVVKQ